MKTLLLTASALALAATMSSVVTSSAQAAPANKNPYCNMAKGQKNLVSWNAYYH